MKAISKDPEDSGIDLEIDLFEDLTKKAKDRLLKKALLGERNRQLPIHKRDKSLPDTDSDEQEEEMAKTSDLQTSKGKPSGVPVTKEDFSEDVAAKIARDAKAAKTPSIKKKV